LEVNLPTNFTEMNKTENIGEIEHYFLKKLLGDGVYGDAYLAYNAKTDS
jgi:hypothetical protein